MFSTKYIYVFIILFSFLFGSAQALKFDRFTTRDGLLSDDVYNLHQDINGYLWLFTNYGVMKYNGKSFKFVLKNLPFNESFIYCIYENEKGQKWIANSNAKIFEIRNDSAFLVKGTEVISDELKKTVSEIYQIYVDDTLNIYITTKHFSYKFLKQKNHKAVNLSNQISPDSVLFHAMEFNRGIISIFKYPGYDEVDLIKKHNFVNIKHTFQNKINNIYNVKCGLLYGPKYFKRFGQDIYASFYNKIVHIYKNKSIKEIPINAVILNFARDKNHHLWIATNNNGLYEMDERDSIVNHYFGDKTVHFVLPDSQNGLWVSTAGSGLFHCKDINELHFDEKEPLGNSISFVKKINEKLFVSNKKGDIFLFENEKVTEICKENINTGEPLDIIRYNSDYLMSFRLGTKILKYDNKSSIARVLDYNKDLYAFKFVQQGRDSFICVQRNRIAILYKSKVIKVLNTNIKTYWGEKRNRTVFLATDNGVYQLINNSLIQPNYLLPTKNCIVTKIKIDNGNNLWFCTKGNGLFKLTSENKLIHYSILKNLPSNIINDIDFSLNNYEILLSTNKGLFHCKYDTLGFNNLNNVYPEDVQTATKYNNYIYLGTKNGLVIIKNNKLTQFPILYFNLIGMFVNGIEKKEFDIRKLSYSENNLEFNFDVISFKDNIRFKYELFGKKKYKGTIVNQQLSFQNLPPGSYTLCAAPDVANYPVNLISIPFVISPAYWQTVLFMILLSFVVLGFVVFIGWVTVKYQRNKLDKKNEAEKLIAEYKLIALKAQINPHFMSNCLTAIQHLIISNKVDEANQYLAKFSLLVRQVLNFSSKSLVTLKDELEITELNIELEQLRFENKFSFQVELDDEVNLSAILLPPLMLQPIVENAIWHGLLPLKKFRKGILQIKIKLFSDFVHIIIEDNGIGRRKSNINISNLKESKGIDITRQRIFNLNNFYNISKADLVYEDLFDNLQNSIGTRVTIILPLISEGLYE